MHTSEKNDFIDDGVSNNLDEHKMEPIKDRGITKKKSNKPMIEKRRRARINECLRQLKEIIVQEKQLDNIRGNRLEKADILEMTVDYIKEVTCEGSSPSCWKNAYELGVERCVQEMLQFMSSQRDTMETSLTQTLANHCRKILHRVSHAEELKGQLTGKKRQLSSTLETPADSSTSPKLQKTDEDSESISYLQGSSTERSVPQTQETIEAVSSTKSTDPNVHSFIPESSDFTISCARPLSGQYRSSSVPVGNMTSHLQTIKCNTSDTCKDIGTSLAANTNTVNISTNQSDKFIDGSFTSQHIDGRGFSISAKTIGQQPANGISQPVIVTCPGNVVILMDRNAILSQVLQQDLNPSLLLQTPIAAVPQTCKPFNSPVTLNTISQQTVITSGSCITSSEYVLPFPKQQFIGQTLSNLSPVSPVNNEIILKQEPDNITWMPLYQAGNFQYVLLSQQHQNESSQQDHLSPAVLQQDSQKTHLSVSNNFQKESNNNFQVNQTLSNQVTNEMFNQTLLNSPNLQQETQLVYTDHPPHEGRETHFTSSRRYSKTDIVNRNPIDANTTSVTDSSFYDNPQPIDQPAKNNVVPIVSALPIDANRHADLHKAQGINFITNKENQQVKEIGYTKLTNNINGTFPQVLAQDCSSHNVDISESRLDRVKHCSPQDGIQRKPSPELRTSQPAAITNNLAPRNSNWPKTSKSNSDLSAQNEVCNHDTLESTKVSTDHQRVFVCWDDSGQVLNLSLKAKEGRNQKSEPSCTATETDINNNQTYDSSEGRLNRMPGQYNSGTFFSDANTNSTFGYFTSNLRSNEEILRHGCEGCHLSSLPSNIIEETPHGCVWRPWAGLDLNHAAH